MQANHKIRDSPQPRWFFSASASDVYSYWLKIISLHLIALWQKYLQSTYHILTCTTYFNVFESYTAPTVPVITSLYFCNAFICTHKHFSLQLFSLVIALFNISCYDRFLQISISTDIKIVFRTLQWQPRLIFPKIRTTIIIFLDPN